MKRTLLLFGLICMITGLLSYPVSITSWNIKDDVKKLNELNFSVDYINKETQTIIAYVPNDLEYNRMLSNGFVATPIPDLAKEYADQLWNDTKDSDDPLRAYYTLTEYHTFMQNTANQYPNICQLVQFGTSVENRPLYFLKISDNVTIQENEPEFRYVSSIHGDEVVGFDLLIRFIQLLTTGYNTNPRITNIVNNTEIWICPMLNPDGYNAHSRYNTNGADLNRNFALPVGSLHPDGMAYQPETLAIMNHGNETTINMSINYHGGALVANYPWDYMYPLAPDNDIFIQAALTYSTTNLPMYNSTEFSQGITNGADWYIALGSLQDWVYAFNGCMDITVEVSNIKWPNSSTLPTFWEQNQESMTAYLEFVQKGLHGTVTNTQGTPLNATIHINSPGIDIKTDPQVGDYHRILLPGNYTVTASASGYQSVTTDIVIPASGSAIYNFVLPTVSFTDVSGTIVNESGIPIANASIKLKLLDNTYQTQTNANGGFSFSNLQQDNYTITVTASGYGIYNSLFTIDQSSNKLVVVLPQPLFFDNFNNGIANWTVQSPWGVVNQSSNNVLSDSPSGNYANNINVDALLTNPISLQNINSPNLSFDIKYSLENNYDFLYVSASTNGSTWNTLKTFTGTANDWQNIVVTLDGYSGSDLYLRFRLSSDNSQNADGIYLDNIMISGLSSQQVVFGDVDSNWLINLNDVKHLLNYSVGNNPIPLIDPYPWETHRLEAADVDNDNEITATDAYYVYSRLNSWLSPFPAQSGNTITFSNPEISIEHNDTALSINSNQPLNLKALNLSISAIGSLNISDVDWDLLDTDALTAINTTRDRMSLIILANELAQSNIANLLYSTNANEINFTGLVNDIPIDIDILITSIDETHLQALPTLLVGNYPNPFNPKTTINLSIAKDNTMVNIIVYNLKGQIVRNLYNDYLNRGIHRIIFDGKDNQNVDLSSGVYLYKLSALGYEQTKKMILVK